uniref:Uncharacterized protein n=1 Tax=Arundo donax TaxID=35708 RepID=A0A0A9AU09_ARUDO
MKTFKSVPHPYDHCAGRQ